MRRGKSLLVPSRLAKDRALKLGDQMRLKVAEKEDTFTVAGIITHSLPTADNYGALVLSRTELESIFGVTTFRFLAVSASPEADVAELERELSKTAETYGMESNTIGRLSNSISQGVCSMLSLLLGLVVIGVVVGSLNLVNTMMMNISQRSREIGILRAQGMTKGQVQRLTIGEAVIMGFIGGMLGIIIGAFLSWVLVDLNRTADFDPRFTFSIPVAIIVLTLSVVSCVIAAFYPAGVAAQTKILEVLRHH
ncbi:MAG: ABC transporter permease [Dehalococcoidia bacterium]|nr:ABC transporter permease [Dehalococcoidia bacterium]